MVDPNADDVSDDDKNADVFVTSQPTTTTSSTTMTFASQSFRQYRETPPDENFFRRKRFGGESGSPNFQTPPIVTTTPATSGFGSATFGAIPMGWPNATASAPISSFRVNQSQFAQTTTTGSFSAQNRTPFFTTASSYFHQQPPSFTNSSSTSNFEQQMCNLAQMLQAGFTGMNQAMQQVAQNLSNLSIHSMNSSTQPQNNSTFSAFNPNTNSTFQPGMPQPRFSMPPPADAVTHVRANGLHIRNRTSPPIPDESGFRTIFISVDGVNNEFIFDRFKVIPKKNANDNMQREILKHVTMKPFRGLVDDRTPCEFIRDFDNTYTLLTDTPARRDIFVACIDKSQCSWLRSASIEQYTFVDVARQLLERYWSPERRSLVWNQFMLSLIHISEPTRPY